MAVMPEYSRNMCDLHTYFKKKRIWFAEKNGPAAKSYGAYVIGNFIAHLRFALFSRANIWYAYKHTYTHTHTHTHIHIYTYIYL